MNPTMNIASAYPDPAPPALTMMVTGLVVAGVLAAWLGLVFLADRTSRQQRADAATSQPGAGSAAAEASGTSQAA